MSVRPLVLVSFALVGCPTDDPAGACTPDATGDLVVALPDDALDLPVTAVILDADGAEHARLTETTTLEGLPGGTWYVVVERGIAYAPEQTIDTAYGALHDTIVKTCVGGEPATVSIAVDRQPSSGRLWVTSGESIVGFSSETLASAPVVVPDARLDVRLVNDFRGASFDPSGNLWVATAPTYESRLQMYRPDQLDGTGEAEPALTVRLPGEFDGTQIGDLWVDPEGTVWALTSFTYDGFVGLRGWTRADLLEHVIAGGDVALAPSIVHEMPEVAGATDLLAVGDDLFVSAFDADRVYRYARTSLGGTMTPTAELSFVDDAGDVRRGPDAMAFAAGRIWLTLWTDASMVAFSPTDTGEIASATIVTGVTDLPSGMDADAAGQVWWGNLPLSGNIELHRFDGATGAPGATVSSADLVAPSDLLFDPVAR